ncbi:MAG: hypothetical protein JW751_11475 [Polyangiaceae bacterium]|nr:hypothetical protein [Polyangiaceae bacterium]
MKNSVAVVFALGLGLGIGCAVGTAMQPGAANAQPVPAGVQKWEYRCDMTLPGVGKKLDEGLAALGSRQRLSDFERSSHGGVVPEGPARW